MPAGDAHSRRAETSQVIIGLTLLTQSRPSTAVPKPLARRKRDTTADELSPPCKPLQFLFVSKTLRWRRAHPNPYILRSRLMDTLTHPCMQLSIRLCASRPKPSTTPLLLASCSATHAWSSEKARNWSSRIC